MKKTEMDGMRKQAGRTAKWEWILLGAVMIAHALLLFRIADFSKIAISYPDEIVYYDLAKSLADGTPFRVHELAYGFRNVAYSLLLSPLMQITNTLTRVRMISAINAVLMSVTAFPVWMICRELKMRRAFRWVTVTVILIWPDIITAGTFMSENLYWPLCAFAGWFCLMSFTRRKTGWAAAAAAVSYGCYFCKELGLCFALAYAAMQMLDPLAQAFRRDGERVSFPRRIAGWLKTVDWKSLAVYLAVFAGLYIGVNKTLLASVDSIYLASTSQVGAFSSLYGILYLLRSIVCYFLAVTGAFLILPVLRPATHFRALREEVRKGWLFAVILLLGTAVTVAYIIGYLEDLGLEQTRLHLRYFAPYIMLLLPPFLADWSGEETPDPADRKKQRRRTAAVCLMFLAGWMLLVRTPLTGAVSENLSLGYLDWLSEVTGEITLDRADRPEAIVFDGGVLLSGGIGLALAGIGLLISKKKPAAARVFFLAVTALVCAGNGMLGFDQLRLHYRASEPLRNDMVQINNAFAEQGLSDSSVLYVCGEWYNDDAKVYDLYFDAGREYVTTWESLKQTMGNARGDRAVLADASMMESIWRTMYTTETVDYLITRSDRDPLTDYMQGLEPADIPTTHGLFRVYRNVNPADFEKLPDPDRDYMLREIVFVRDGYNANEYAVSGLSGCEELFSWTEGNDLVLRIEDLDAEGPVTVRIDTYTTYNGTQPFTVLQGGMEIARGELLGDDAAEFEASPTDGELQLTIRLPQAISPSQTGQSGDPRLLALALRTIRILQRPAE